MKLIVMAAMVVTTIEAMSFHDVKSQCPSSRRNFRVMNRIYKGEETDIKEWPFMVNLAICLPTVLSRCGGTVITKHHILTAAHCIYDKKLGKYINASNVWAGFAHSYRKEMEYTNVREIYGDPASIGSLATGHDIALLVVDRITKAAQQPVLLSTTRFELKHKQLTILGWGYTENGMQSDVLRKANMPGIEMKSPNPDQIGVIVSDSRTDGGDSGGPILLKNSKGIIQFGISSGFNSWVTIFTDVSTYIPWIEQKIKESKYRETLQKASVH